MTTQLLTATGHDLVTPDGTLIEYKIIDERRAEGTVLIEAIAPYFRGFEIDSKLVKFNIKSALAQLGLDGIGTEYEINRNSSSARVKVTFTAHGKIAEDLLKILPLGSFVGKLFAADDRRIVRDPGYLSRMFSRSDRWGNPLLSLGGLHGSKDLILDKVEGRTIAYLSLLNGVLGYDAQIYSFLPSFSKALIVNESLRKWVELHQHWIANKPRMSEGNDILLVRTHPLHIRTVFARVASELLPPGYHHTTASVLQPDTHESGNIYELFGKSEIELTDIPLEFYTLDPFREHVFFSDRDQLLEELEDPKSLFKAFETAPPPNPAKAATFVVKGTQLLSLTPNDWVVRDPKLQEFPGSIQSLRQQFMAERYIEQQPSYPILERIDEGSITSQGILLTRYFPSPLMKRMLLSNHVQDCLKAIYFQKPSMGFDQFFSSEDRAMLVDLDKFGIPVFWVDEISGQILRYVHKHDRDSGMFVPLNRIEAFMKSSVWGIYGSNLHEGDFAVELKKLLEGLLVMKNEVNHPLLNPKTPLALVTGGGPGAMAVGNRIAKEVGILSCANIVDFRQKDDAAINEQKQNPYIDAKMTYRLDKLVERQAEFNLDFPIFLMGGIGTDFEQSLEEVRRKVGAVQATPILLFGSNEYWEAKITSRFQCNLRSGTIRGSEWVSNCFFAVENAEQGLAIYRRYFTETLGIGKHGPTYDLGFVRYD